MNLEFKITCKGLGIMSVINDESLSLKLFVILSRDLQSITKRIEKVIKIYGLNPTEFAVLKLLYSKGDQPIQNMETKYYLQVVVSRMRQLLQKVLNWWILFFLSIKRGFGKYLVVWTILRKNDN